jgi:hypothetical protein
MTGRERLNAIVHREPVDKLSWTTLIDAATLAGLPERLRENGGIEFYRHIGCDIFLLNGWGTTRKFRAPELRWAADVEESVRVENDQLIREWRTPRGVLTTVSRSGHPLKYPVDSLKSLRIYREMWESAHFGAHDDEPVLAGINSLIGDDGIVTRFWGPSAIPLLLQDHMGAERFYYLLSDHRREMEDLIGVIHARQLQAFHIIAQGPCEVVTLCENTSTRYISPDVYRRYNMPHVCDFVDIMHAQRKTALIHMCGHILDILPDIKQTRLDGVHALTPPPTANTPWETALDILGEDIIIIGLLDPTVFCSGPVGEIGAALDLLYTPRLRRAHFCLALGADGIAVPLERFLAVKQWMERRGR